MFDVVHGHQVGNFLDGRVDDEPATKERDHRLKIELAKEEPAVFTAEPEEGLREQREDIHDNDQEDDAESYRETDAPAPHHGRLAVFLADPF